MTSAVKKIAWHHFRFDVPNDWEVTAYSTERRAGRLEFSTRHGFQGTIGWEPYRTAPHLDTLMVSFLRQSGADMDTHALRDGLRTERVGPFLVGWVDPGLPCQAMAYLDEEKTLLRWAFASGEACRMADVYKPIASSFEPNGAAARQYALFGLHFTLPREYELERMHVAAASVSMAFESRTRAQVALYRWGMPEVVLAGQHLPDFLAGLLGHDGCRVHDVQRIMFAGRDAAHATYDRRGEHRMDRFMGRIWTNGEAWLWHHEDEQRLYALRQIAPNGVPRLDMRKVFDT